MKYDKGNGQTVQISREMARMIDREQGRVRINADQREAYTQLMAAMNIAHMASDTMKPLFKKLKLWRLAATIYPLLHKLMMDFSCKVSVEQICALQHNTANAYINVSCSRMPEMVNIDERTLHNLVDCARGGLHDQDGVQRNCRNCMACFDRAEWQECPLYEMLNGTLCSMAEKEGLSESDCPYMLEQVGDL